MNVKDLKEKLKEYDDSLEIIIMSNEDPSFLKKIGIETKENHSYSKGYSPFDEDNLEIGLVLKDY